MKTLLVNGNIRTLDARDRVCKSILFDDRSIIEVGDDIDARLRHDNDIEVIDLKGKTVLPGFIDCHNHLLWWSTSKLGIDFLADSIKDIPQLLNTISENGRLLKSTSWLKVANFDENLLKERRRPTIEELDSVSPHFPLVIMRRCAHEYIANSMALKLAGIDEYTEEPKGGVIQRNKETDKLTGVLKDSAMDILQRAMGSYSQEELSTALELGYETILSEGITTVHETGVGYFQSLVGEMAAYQNVQKKGKLKVRTRLYIRSRDLKDDMSMLGIREGFGSDMLNIGGVKFFEDGAYSVHTAAFLKPYTNMPDTFGCILYTKEELKRLYEECHLHGLQTATHAIGDLAVNEVLECFEEIKARHGWNDMRHRIEHFMVVSPEQMERAKNCGLVIMSNASEIYFYGDSMVENLGMERASRSYPLRSMIDKGVRLACGSDRPCGDGNPLITMRTAIERKTRDGKDLSGSESVTVDEMIKIWTRGSAFAEFSEDKKGTLEPGKFADIIVLEEDPYKVKTSELTDIKVDYTFVGGKLSYSR
ncbi:amidohydrolase [Cloacibacillus porcorum]|uniref:amidohydrolase n=1 Tax=Cloacibacillus porcorum TaxID=1197717 RepID=UPI0023F10615|nr:amidohydrolase [Cloacibacillus porcorum]MDD7649149.1 amidohydrolase [Cloacibacillus porcorum]MDY4094779.1 amidohydrolase [Cloacibacillus porcorum]